jgi:hypothetical protein
MRRRKWKANWLGWMACAVAMPSAAFLLGSGDLPAQGPRAADSRTARGTVQSMTTAPKGEIDGAVLDDGTVLHWPPHLADRFSSAVERGDRVSAVGQMETNREGEDWFEVQTLTNLDSNATVENDERGRRPKKGRKAPPPPPRQSAPGETIRGTVERMTTAPKGEIDGAVLDDGTLIHWPPHLQARFTAAVARGDRISAEGRMETNREGVDWFEVQTLTNLDSDATAENDERGRPPKKGRRGPPPPPRQSGATQTVRGTVERMTTAPKGEIDGALLDDGRVIHWPPHLQDRFTKVLAKGDRVEVTGSQETTKKGDEHFEVQSLTNVRTDASADNDDNAAPPRRADTGSRADRLRQLKQQVERLEREIERLERDL